MKVLVIDDEAIVRRSLRRALEAKGHSVVEAEDGDRGLAEWTSCAPDLVYLDVLMPRRTGPEVLGALTREARRSARVILMSAFMGEYDSEKAKQLGADLYLAKPFTDIFAVVQAGEDLLSAP